MRCRANRCRVRACQWRQIQRAEGARLPSVRHRELARSGAGGADRLQPVLTVSDQPGFVQRSGMIRATAPTAAGCASRIHLGAASRAGLAVLRSAVAGGPRDQTPLRLEARHDRHAAVPDPPPLRAAAAANRLLVVGSTLLASLLLFVVVTVMEYRTLSRQRVERGRGASGPGAGAERQCALGDCWAMRGVDVRTTAPGEQMPDAAHMLALQAGITDGRCPVRWRRSSSTRRAAGPDCCLTHRCSRR